MVYLGLYIRLFSVPNQQFLFELRNEIIVRLAVDLLFSLRNGLVYSQIKPLHKQLDIITGTTVTTL